MSLNVHCSLEHQSIQLIEVRLNKVLLYWIKNTCHDYERVQKDFKGHLSTMHVTWALVGIGPNTSLSMPCFQGYRYKLLKIRKFHLFISLLMVIMLSHHKLFNFYCITTSIIELKHILLVNTQDIFVFRLKKRSVETSFV